MHPLLKRILVNGTITAAVLAVIGFGYVELAGLYLSGQAPARASIEAPATDDADPLFNSLQSRVPITMAMWGFVFVAVGEWVMDRLRRRRPPEPPPEEKVDVATVLLEEILAKVEAERAVAAASNPTTSAAPAENTPVAS